MWKLTFFLFVVTSSLTRSCKEEDSIDISDGVQDDSHNILHDGLIYEAGEYFANSNGTRGCVCEKRVCIQKCCPMGYAYHEKECIKTGIPFKLTVIDKYFNVLSLNITEHFHFKPTKPTCVGDEARVRLREVFEDKVFVRNDGSLFIEVPNRIPPWTLKKPNKYCVDTFLYENENGNKSSNFDALVCFTEDEDPANYLLSSTCMIISCVFILATVTVYAWLPELRNLHGRVLMAYLISVFVAFLNLGTMQILLYFNNILLTVCVTMTFIIYYTLLAAFFWLNVMCFDIWWTFSGKRGRSFSGTQQSKFLAYCKYAFGVPTILTALLIGLEFSGIPPRPFLPTIRQDGCFLTGDTKLLYLYVPIVVLCVANLVFFTLTALKIAETKRQTVVLKSAESATHDKQKSEQQRLLLYVKLFAVMGVNWILEVISHFFPEANKIWCFTDAYNLLIGVLIFGIFVCKRKIFRHMKKRYTQVRGGSLSKSQYSSRTYSTRDDMALSTRN